MLMTLLLTFVKVFLGVLGFAVVLVFLWGAYLALALRKRSAADTAFLASDFPDENYGGSE